MGTYKNSVEATSNVTADTEDSWIELTAPAGVAPAIKRFNIGVVTAAQDGRVSWRLVRKSVAGTGGVAQTPVKKDPTFPASVSTVNVKTGTTAFGVGTVTDVVDQGAFNTRAFYEWVARGNEEFAVTAAAGIIGLVIKVSIASIVLRVSWETEE